MLLVDIWLAGKSQKTVDAYSRDLRDFARYLGLDEQEEAARGLLSLSHGEANARVLGYRGSLVDRGLSTATVNRRLAAVRSLVALGRSLGLVTWAIDVPNLRQRPYRDTRGPDLEVFSRIVARVRSRTDSKGRRDHALFRLLFDLGLRRSEVVSLNFESLEDGLRGLWVIGKGWREPERLTLPEQTKAALKTWLDDRGWHPGPLFVCLHQRKPERLTDTGLYRIVREWGAQEGITLSPHRIRHAAITAALDGTRDFRSVQRFSRHRDPKVILVYDDNREDLGGEIARAIATRV